MSSTPGKVPDGSGPDPLTHRVDEYLGSLDWVRESGSRSRDEGHVFHIEAFIVPRRGRTPSLAQLAEAHHGCVELDWKVQDIVLVPVAELPEIYRNGARLR